MQIEKGTFYYLISGECRDCLVVIVHELFKKAVDDKYKETDPKQKELASKMVDHFYELETQLRLAEGGRATY